MMTHNRWSTPRAGASILLGGVLALALLVSSPAAAAPLTLHFDDIAVCADTFANAGASNYNGFQWSASWATECNADFASYNNSFSAPSPQNAAGNGFGEFGITVSRNSTFNFLGALITSWTALDQFAPFSSTSIQIYGFLNNVQVGSLFQNLGAGYAPLNMANVIGTFNGIDKLEFDSSDPQAQVSWLLDDMQFDVQPQAPPQVPEPASVLLLGSGLAIVAARARAGRGSRI